MNTGELALLGLVGLAITLLLLFLRFFLNPLGLGPAKQKVLGSHFFELNAPDLSFLTLLIDGERAYDTIFNSIENVTESVFIQAFIWKDDPTGNQMVDSALMAANNGACITIRKDLLGSYFEIKDMLKGKPSPVFADSKMKKHGSVRIILNPLDNPDHSKYYIFDGRRIIFGGMNIAIEYHKHLHDYMVMIDDEKITGALERKLLKNGDWPQIPGLFPAINNSRICEIRTAYIEMILNAKDRVILQHAYFADGAIVSAIIEAASNGTQIDMVLPKSPDINKYANAVSINTLLKSAGADNINVWLYPNVSHAKVGLADGKIAAVGSANFTHRSMRRNRELTLFAHGSTDDQFIKDLATRLESDIGISEKVTIPIKLSATERLLAIYDFIVW